MNWHMFVTALDRKELSDLSSAVYERTRELGLEEVRSGKHSLTDDERELVAQGKYIDAIKSVRSRTHLDLVSAKMLVDKE